MDLKKSEMIYHGCSKRNIDGTNRLIKKDMFVQNQQIFHFGWMHKMFLIKLKLDRKKKIKKM